MIPYFDRPHPDSSGISLEWFEHISEIPYLGSDGSVAMHRHSFYEMVLILRGSCRHSYRGSEIPLIPGDLFLVPPGIPHSYRFSDNISICNCQFEPEVLDSQSRQFVSDISYTALQQKSSTAQRLADVRAHWKEDAALSVRHIGNINGQGIIHLGRAEQARIAQMLSDILCEQKEQHFAFPRMKQMLLGQMLVQIKRVQMHQFDQIEQSASWQDEMVNAIMSEIEHDLTADYDFNEIARAQNISISYFRLIFKNITGLSPVEYLNRVRILRALELLQTTQTPIAEIAAAVGILDPNYFSRLFKKIIGYPPRYFKSIGTL